MRRTLTRPLLCCYFFNDTSPTEIYTLSLHDALPILVPDEPSAGGIERHQTIAKQILAFAVRRSEEHTSELQSLTNLVCRLLLEKKKIISTTAAAAFAATVACDIAMGSGLAARACAWR